MEIVGMHLLPPRFALFFCRVAKMDKTVKGARIRSTKGGNTERQRQQPEGRNFENVSFKKQFQKYTCPYIFLKNIYPWAAGTYRFLYWGAGWVSQLFIYIFSFQNIVS
jgi:hypothetical protein